MLVFSMRRILSAGFRRLNVPLLQSKDWMLLYKLKRQLGSMTRYESGTIVVDDWDIEYVDAASFVSAFENVVYKRFNDFNSEKSAPVILDCGANIGVSVIHYKKLYPNSRVIAFEPDHDLCKVLRRNLRANSITNVEIVEAAVWKEADEIYFFSEGADAGRLDNSINGIDDLVSRSQKGTKRKVRTIRLADYLNEPVDFIKLDIEGAESMVLESCASELINVKTMVVEFHLTNSRPMELAIVMKALADAGFNVSVNSYGQWVSLLNKDSITHSAVEYDQYLLIDAWR